MNITQQSGPGDPATWPACTGHPNDPRTDVDDESLLSEQMLGGIAVTVEYDLGFANLPVIAGIWIAGEFAEAFRFSQPTLSSWIEAITREIAQSGGSPEAREIDVADLTPGERDSLFGGLS